MADSHTERPDERVTLTRHDPLLLVDVEVEFVPLASLERVEAERDRLVEALTNLRRAFNRMPDAGLHDGDPRRAWWFETFTEREAARRVLASLDLEDEG